MSDTSRPPPIPARPPGWVPTRPNPGSGQPIQQHNPEPRPPQPQYEWHNQQSSNQSSYVLPPNDPYHSQPPLQNSLPQQSHQGVQQSPPQQYSQQYPPQPYHSQHTSQQHAPQHYLPQQYFPQQYLPQQYPPHQFPQQAQSLQQGHAPQSYSEQDAQYSQDSHQYANIPYPSQPPYSQQTTPPQHPNMQQQGQKCEIWQPSVGTTWQYVLQHRVKLDHTIEETSVWIIDLFDSTSSDVADLHRRGRKVVAYFSAGSYEDWRSDASSFPKSDMGRKVDDWEGEKWIRTSSQAIRNIMMARMDLARAKGFDGIDPDNVDGYDNKNGLGLSKNDAIDYVHFLAREAHSRGLSCGLKNAAEIIPRVIGEVQWCVQEQCVQYEDEDEYLPFIRQGKPVFHVEYPKGEDTDSSKCNNDKEVTGKRLQKCVKAREMGFSTIIKNIRLDQWVQRC